MLASFREHCLAEAHFPRRTLLGNWVKRSSAPCEVGASSSSPLTPLFLIAIIEARERRCSALIRLIKVLAAAALMVVLMASTVPPAFAYVGQGEGFENEGEGYGNVDGYGIEEHRPKKPTTGEAGIGSACGKYDEDPPRSECD